MTITAIILLALAMSTDAFAAAIGKGTVLRHPRWTEALRIGLIFGGLLLIGIGAAILKDHLAAS